MGERLVRRVGIGRDENVLDIACGTGNAALRAAAAGGRVVGVDLTPELFIAGRALAAEAGVEIQWVEGDAEELPFEDERFEVVLSTFGVMLRHATRWRRASSCVYCDRWDVSGSPAGPRRGSRAPSSRRWGRVRPARPAVRATPLLWGTENHVRHIFAGTGVTLEFARESVPPPPFDTPGEAVDWNAERFGPLMMLRGLLEQQGRWEEARAKMISIYGSGAPAEYLVVQGRKEG